MAKKPGRKKKTKKQKLAAECDQLWKDIVKFRDKYTCQKCHKHPLLGANCHASHVIPKSRSRSLAFAPLNGKTLCFHCHINWWHKHPVEAGPWYRKTFAERWQWLEVQERIPVTITELWYSDHIKYLRWYFLLLRRSL